MTISKLAVYDAICGRQFQLSTLEANHISTVLELQLLISTDTLSCIEVPPEHQILVLESGLHLKDSDFTKYTEMKIFLFDKRFLLSNDMLVKSDKFEQSLDSTIIHRHPVQIIEGKIFSTP